MYRVKAIVPVYPITYLLAEQGSKSNIKKKQYCRYCKEEITEENFFRKNVCCKCKGEVNEEVLESNS